jgi:hypothetical protein
LVWATAVVEAEASAEAVTAAAADTAEQYRLLRTPLHITMQQKCSPYRGAFFVVYFLLSR